MRLLIVAIISVLLSACGTLISGTEQRIKVNAFDQLGNPVKSAKCYVRDANDMTHTASYDNHAISVQRSRHPIDIACMDDKFRTQSYQVHSYNNSEIYENLAYRIVQPVQTLSYYAFADRTPHYMRNDITREVTDRPDTVGKFYGAFPYVIFPYATYSSPLSFIWDHRSVLTYPDHISGAFWEYPHNINMTFSSLKTLTNYEYSHKPIAIPQGINYINMIE